MASTRDGNATCIIDDPRNHGREYVFRSSRSFPPPQKAAADPAKKKIRTGLPASRSTTRRVTNRVTKPAKKVPKTLTLRRAIIIRDSLNEVIIQSREGVQVDWKNKLLQSLQAPLPSAGRPCTDPITGSDVDHWLKNKQFAEALQELNEVESPVASTSGRESSPEPSPASPQPVLMSEDPPMPSSSAEDMDDVGDEKYWWMIGNEEFPEVSPFSVNMPVPLKIIKYEPVEVESVDYLESESYPEPEVSLRSSSIADEDLEESEAKPDPEQELPVAGVMRQMLFCFEEADRLLNTLEPLGYSQPQNIQTFRHLVLGANSFLFNTMLVPEEANN